MNPCHMTPTANCPSFWFHLAAGLGAFVRAAPLSERAASLDLALVAECDDAVVDVLKGFIGMAGVRAIRMAMEAGHV
jgi:hypothetical protein